MTRSPLRIVAAAALTLGCAACSVGALVPRPAVTKPSSAVDALKQAGKITVGIKYDQPGFGWRPTANAEPVGFDIDIAKMIVARLGIPLNKITWKETVSKNREKFLREGTIDMLVATYPITDARRIVVGQAGPYDVTGVQLLVRKNDHSIKGIQSFPGHKACSVKGSSSIRVFQQLVGVIPQSMDKYTQCIDLMLAGKVDAVASYGDILLGYAAQKPDKLKVVGDTLDEGRFGIGFKKGDTKFCQLITTTLAQAFKDGSWKKAYEANLGKALKVKTPPPPRSIPASERSQSRSHFSWASAWLSRGPT